ncbi:MAG: Maf family protein, partial [Dehalococcoidia bacterium]|nr:Maf family protein [Dehalococcoidia bacterium]
MLYLASQSPRRRALLRQLGQPFRVVRSSHRERIHPRRTPSWNAMRNAHGKAAKARVPRDARGLVIGADTFLYFQGRVLGKPASMRQARAFLRSLSGRSHWVYTGVCVRDPRTGVHRCAYDKARVTFKRLTKEAITRVFRRVPPLDKAGG